MRVLSPRPRDENEKILSSRPYLREEYKTSEENINNMFAGGAFDAGEGGTSFRFNFAGDDDGDGVRAVRGEYNSFTPRVESARVSTS